jgi:hypothetical protein
MKRQWSRGGAEDEIRGQLSIVWNESESKADAAPSPGRGERVDIQSATVAPAAVAGKGASARKRPLSRHAGVVARFPVPRPLPAAVAAGRFGQDEDGNVIRPAADEVRAITENQVDKLIGMLDAMSPAPGRTATTEFLPESFHAIIAAYGHDFGDHAARQLEAYARRQSSLDESDRTDHTWQR